MKYLVILFNLLILSILLKAGTPVLIDEGEGAQTTYILTENTKNLISFKVKINSYELENQITPKGIASIVRSETSVPLYHKGAPDLPKLVKSIIIPDKGNTTIKIEPISYVDVEAIDISPSKGIIGREENPADIPFLWNESYNKDAFYPHTLGQLNTPYVFRNYRGQAVEIYPFQYNPVRKVLRVFTELQITVTSNKEQGINEKNTNAIKFNEVFNNIYSKQFLNYPKNKKYAPVSEEGSMLIIAHDDFYEQAFEFLKWKRQRGIDVEIFTYREIGGTSLDLYDFVKDYYTTRGLTYLVLIGDAEHISPLNKGGDSDAAYGHIEGEDSYAEVLVGRLSAQSALDLQVQIDKTLFYERDIDTSATWLNKATCIASIEGGLGIGDNDETDIQHMNKIREDLLNYGYEVVDQIYDPGATSNQVIESLNEGRGLINYVGHGSNTQLVTSAFGPTSIGQLSNYYKTPFMFDVACVNGNFKPTTCFAEYFMRANKDTVPTGVVAIIASTINQEWAPPMNAQDEMIDILTESYSDNKKQTFGGIAINGCMFMNDNYGSIGEIMTNTWTIFGDPSLMVRTKAPEKIIANYQDYIVHGTESYTVNADVEGAVVTLLINDNLVSKQIIKGGEAKLSIPFQPQINSGVLTITAFNKKSIVDTITFISPEGPYIIVDNYTIKDENSNGIYEFGEKIDFAFDLKNIGNDKAESFTVKLNSIDAYAQVNDEMNNYLIEILDSNSMVTTNEFSLNISDSVVDQQSIDLILKIQVSEDEEQQTEIRFKVAAPDLSILNYEFKEIDGDFNQRVDAGEEVEIVIPVVNTGAVAVQNAKLEIALPSPYVNVKQSAQVVDSIAVGDTVWFNYPAQTNLSTPSGSTVTMETKLYGGRNYSKLQQFIIGQQPELTVGTDTIESVKYPFNNFYQANKTQMLFTVNDLGTGTKIIKGISLCNSRIPDSDDKRWLSSFRIRLMHTDKMELADDYTSLTGSVTVLNNDYQLPKSSEVYIEFEAEFEYNGIDNLIVELSWGKNNYYENANSFSTLSSHTTNNSVAYGYQDNTSYPRYMGVSNLRPNIVFQFNGNDVSIFNTVFKVSESGSSTLCENAKITIGGAEYYTNANGLYELDLARGEYDVVVEYENKILKSVVSVIENNQQVNLDFTLLSSNNSPVGFSLYPNPVKDEFQIIIPTDEAWISIADIGGEILLEKQISNKSVINVNQLKAGIYIVNVVGDKFSVNKKIAVVN